MIYRCQFVFKFALLITIFFSKMVFSQWEHVFDPETGCNIYALTRSGSNLLAGSCNGIYISSDNGKNWYQSEFQKNINLFFEYDNTLYTGTGGIFSSTNNGQTWTEVGLTTKSILSLTILDSILYAGTHDGLFRSYDKGSTWASTDISCDVLSLVNRGDTICVGLGSITFIKTSSDINRDGIFFSSDSGDNWVYTGISNLPYTFVYNDKYLFAGTSGFSVFRSPDNGKNWVRSSIGIKGYNIRTLVCNENIIFAGGDSGVFVSTNNGDNWSSFNSGLNHYYGKTVLALTIFEDTLFAGVAGSGIWKRSISDLNTPIMNDKDKNLVTKFSLKQNYPNPFNYSTEIEFYLPFGDHIILNLYNSAGRQVFTLKDQFLSAGYHTVFWDASKFSSGTYYYQIRTNKYTSTRKMVLVK
jgi:photosystem II stability/assembly factor-like uncharacterized protein